MDSELPLRRLWEPSCESVYVPYPVVTPQASDAAGLSAQYAGNQWKPGGVSYDGSGNQTANGLGSYAFDAENRMATATIPGLGTESYTYDGEGRRVKRSGPLGTTIYAYDLGGKVAAEYQTPAGTVVMTAYRFEDHLGTTRMVSDGTATGYLKRFDYLPFGEEIAAGVNGRGAKYSSLSYPTVSQDGVPLKFTGKERDSETGLDYFGARYFSGAQGRFTSPDPYNAILQASRDEFNAYLSQPQNWNKYVYTWNNPFRYVDPDGERVYVVAYTTGNSHGDAEFRRTAETRAAEIRGQQGFDPEKDTVLVRGVMSKADFKGLIAEANALDKTYGQVQSVDLIAHNQDDRDGAGPVFHYQAGYGHTELFTQPELSQLKVNWSGSASASVIGCRTALSFTQMFADAQGVPTAGYERFAYFSSSRSRMVDIGPTGPVYLQGGDGPNSNGPVSAVRYWLGLGRADTMKVAMPRQPR